MRIAVDAMGGDFAPAVVIEAVADALREIPDVDIHLVGHQQKLAHYLLKAKLKESDRLHFVHAEEVVEMSDLSTAVDIATEEGSSPEEKRSKEGSKARICFKSCVI